MESLNHNSSKKRVVEENANISTFRRRNNILILLFLFLIISLTLILGTLIISILHVRNKTSASYKSLLIPPIEAYCYISDKESCLRHLNPIISNRFIADPNHIFTISLQTAAKDLQHIISLTLSNSAFNSCSYSLRDGSDQIRDPLERIRVNPFVETLSKEQRGEMMKRIIAAQENVISCVDDLAKVDESTDVVDIDVVRAKLGDVKWYLYGAEDYLLGYENILVMFTGENGGGYRRT